MKIQTIEIINYKAFHGNHLIKVGGKNLFIYGENGSGKSSLYYALKDFISIYLGMIKRHVQGIPCKILFSVRKNKLDTVRRFQLTCRFVASRKSLDEFCKVVSGLRRARLKEFPTAMIR